MDHVSFNAMYYEYALDYAKLEASYWGLEYEVAQTYREEIARLFNTNDYPLSQDDYLAAANYALLEWDI